MECRSLRESGDELRKFDVAVFAASCDTPETNRKFAEALALDYPILSDPGRGVARAYGVVDGDKRWPRRWTFTIGKDGRILHVDRDVHVMSAGGTLAKRFSELGIARR